MRYPIHTALTWATPDEKKAIYGENLIMVENCDDLFTLLDQAKEEGCFFRGQRDSTWKVVSSAQRKWRTAKNITNGVPFSSGYGGFLSGILLGAKHSRPICNLPDRLKDHHIWGFLQHYSFCTPFIDFSNNPLTALHFATRHHSGREPFSIYIWNGMKLTNHNENYLDDLDRVISVSNIGDTFEDWGKARPSASDSYRVGEYSLDDDSGEIAFEVNKSSGWPSIITTGRMNLQNGLFVYYPRQEISLDEFVFDHHPKKLSASPSSLLSGLKCLECKAVCVQKIRQRLANKGISDQTLGLSDFQLERELAIIRECLISQLVTDIP